MAHLPRPGGFYEVQKEVVRDGPYNSYSAEYRAKEYGTPGYPVGHDHHHPGYADSVTEVVAYETAPGYYRHGGPTEIVERREEIVRDNAHGPYSGIY